MATGLFVFSFGVYLVRYLNAIRRSPPPSDRSAQDGRSSETTETSPEVDETGPSVERSLSISSLL